MPTLAPRTAAPAGSDDAEPEAAAEPGLRERKKLETRRALIDAAIDLSSQHGFDRTTVEDIADSVGVSPRTFHRYFARKEDAVLGDSPARLERFRERLAGAEGTVLDGVRAAALATAGELMEASARERSRSRLVAETPSLRAHNLGLYDEWAAAVSEHAASATGAEATDRWPAAFGAVTMAALTSATRRWAAADDLDLAEEFDAVLELLSGLDRPAERPTRRR
jgi:AcrR family transcriptional regulator